MHQIPSSLPPLFSGDRLVVYGVLKASENENEGDDNEARLEGMLGNDEEVQHVIRFSSPIAVENKGYALLHQLAAKSFVQENQDGYTERNKGQEFEEAKRSTISISKTANVVSKLTSFVAVDKDSNQPVTGPLRKHFVPSYEDLACSMPKRRKRVAKKHLRNKRRSTGVSLFFGDEAPAPLPSALKSESVKSFCPSAPDSMSQKTKDSPAVLSVTEKNEWFDLEAEQAALPPSSQRKKDGPSFLALVMFQKASGSWDLTDQLVSLCGTNRDALIKGCPKEIAVDTGEGKLLWATALALVLLMGKFLDQKDEWEMIAEKGTKWMKRNLPAAVKYENVLEAAASSVGVQIKLGQ